MAAVAVVVVIGAVAVVSALDDRGESPVRESGRLLPATSSLPASGVCGRAAGTVLTIRIERDTPMPRCASVTGSQRLRVVNRTGDYGGHARTVTVSWIPGRTFTLHPGESKSFDERFGRYLARGVHDLRVVSQYRAEIWLR